MVLAGHPEHGDHRSGQFLGQFTGQADDVQDLEGYVERSAEEHQLVSGGHRQCFGPGQAVQVGPHGWIHRKTHVLSLQRLHQYRPNLGVEGPIVGGLLEPGAIGPEERMFPEAFIAGQIIHHQG